jgi:hypothetical protein
VKVVAKYCMLWKSFGHATGDTSLISAVYLSNSYKTASGTVSLLSMLSDLLRERIILISDSSVYKYYVPPQAIFHIYHYT